MNIILATRNPSKAKQVGLIFEDSPFRVLLLDEAGIQGEGTEEDGTTLHNNARIKARYAHEKRPDVWCMADDSGLFIRVLNGEPGVDSAVWAGKCAATETITEHCLAQMCGMKDRYATWKSLAVLVSPAGDEFVFEGELHGHLLEAAPVPAKPKMPYSPLFVPIGETRCIAQLSTEEENRISHRGQAFRKLRSFLESRS